MFLRASQFLLRGGLSRAGGGPAPRTRGASCKPRLSAKLLLIGLLLAGAHAAAQAAESDLPRPNILWLSCEDISPHLGCYGDALATTPHLDRFARQSTLYRNAFVCAGVCAPCRSTIITGMYQTTLGTHHMRCTAQLPRHIRPFPELLRQAGYYCTNNSKTDYQFTAPKSTWDESSRGAHWKNRPDPEQPFFAVFNYTGCHESGIANTSKYEQVTRGLTPHDRDRVAATLPPYYPDTPRVREDWGRYYDVITAMDRWIGRHLEELAEAGLAERTIVFFWSDHGVGLPRAKRWLYDSGMRVPLIVRIPAGFRQPPQGEPGTSTDQLVSLLDLGPTVLRLAGVPIPAHLQGQPFLGRDLPPPRRYVYAARDRMDERYDTIRAVRDKRFKYLRNYEPLKTYYQYMNTPEQGATMKEIRRVAAAGKLPPAAAALMAPRKPLEELYDTQADPHEIRNLAADPEYTEVLNRLRDAHLRWIVETRDLGLVPEGELAAREQQAGSRFAIFQGAQSVRVIRRIRDAATLGSKGAGALPQLRELLRDDEPAVRYWAAIHLGNLAGAAKPASADLTEMLRDPARVVRVAVARALCRIGEPENALPTLADVLDQGAQWERLFAAVVLDELDDAARPALEAMRRNKSYREGLVADGKYTVRVLNRALNELQGTNEQVP